MSARDRMNSASIAPGAILKTEYFNIGSANSIEYNVDQEFMLMAEHLAVDFVVTIPTFNDGDFEGGYVAGDALEVSRNAGNTSNIDIKPGVSWIGGRRYKQVNTISDYNLSGTTPATLHYIRLKYTYSTAQFTFIAETSISSDSATVKYLSLASATWNTGGTFWDNDFTDMRATNTSLPTPVGFIGSEVANYILTVRNTNASKLSADIDGYLRVGTPSTDGKINLYGKDATEGLTIYNNSGLYSALISVNNTDQIYIDDKLEVDTTITVGGTTIQSASISGITSFSFGASPSLTTASGDFNWNSENFAAVGAIGSGAITSTGIVEGSQLKSAIPIGTTPLLITSTTKVDNLNVDRVDNYHFDQPLLQASTPTFGSVSITGGPTLSATGIAGASGDNISGFTDIAISGSVTSGTWAGSVIADAYIANDIKLTNLTQITTKSHTVLSDKGTNTHAAIDTHISTSNTHYLQSAITTVGTIASGTWQGTDVGVAYGGTGISNPTNHGILVGSGTSAVTALGAGTANYLLKSGGSGADPSWTNTLSVASVTASGDVLVNSTKSLSDASMIGSSNAAYVPCSFHHGYYYTFSSTSTGLYNTSGDDMDLIYVLPLPPSLNGLKLYINGTRIKVNEAGAAYYVDNTYVIAASAGSPAIIDTDTTNKGAIGASQYWADSFTAIDCSSYSELSVRLDCVNSTVSGNLYIDHVSIKCYYA